MKLQCGREEIFTSVYMVSGCCEIRVGCRVFCVFWTKSLTTFTCFGKAAAKRILVEKRASKRCGRKSAIHVLRQTEWQNAQNNNDDNSISREILWHHMQITNKYFCISITAFLSLSRCRRPICDKIFVWRTVVVVVCLCTRSFSSISQSTVRRVTLFCRHFFSLECLKQFTQHSYYFNGIYWIFSVEPNK